MAKETLTLGPNDVENAVNAVGDAAKAVGAGTFDQIFKGFSVGGSVLACVNGSVTFLRLLGVLEDPTQSKLDSILETVTAMNEQMAQMESMLAGITTQMTALQASEAFHARAEKANYMKEAWRDFSTDFMINTMDAYMVEYDGMIRDGMRDWCKSRWGEEDITIYYKDTE